MNDHPTALHGKLRGIQLGPKMQALDERERIFAYAYAVGIAGSVPEAAKLAGYSDRKVSATGKRSNSLNSKAYQVLHRPRVQAAIREVSDVAFDALRPL